MERPDLGRIGFVLDSVALRKLRETTSTPPVAGWVLDNSGKKKKRAHAEACAR